MYKFNRQDNSFFYLPFDSYQNAIDFVNNIEQVQIEEVPNFTKIPSLEKLESDKAFLLFMMDRFIHLNRLNNITSLESGELLTAFSTIKQLSEVGAVPEVYGSINALIAPIGRVYTAQRQTDDLIVIGSYLNIR